MKDVNSPRRLPETSPRLAIVDVKPAESKKSRSATAGLSWLATATDVEDPVTTGQVATATVAGFVLALALVVAIELLTWWAQQALDDNGRRRLQRFRLLSYAPVLLLFLGVFGVRFPPPIVVLSLVVFCRGLLVYRALEPEQRAALTSTNGWLAFAFLISGCAALIYQIVWQRALYTLFGVNISSITLVVSLFMFGLGLGALAGGVLAKRLPHKALLVFLLCEVGIGLFGAVSLPLIRWVGTATLGESQLVVALVVFLLLSVPTLLMGATLPVLVGYVDRFYRNAGRSVGLLYSINTIGAAIACFLTADLLFVVMGQQASLLVAVVLNLGGMFPVLCHYGSPEQNVGLAVSRLYLANILGCVAGPLLTGFVLMEQFSSIVATGEVGRNSTVRWTFAARTRRSRRASTR